jgi:FkbM family methyltransferase
MLEKYDLDPQDLSVLINIANKFAAENRHDSALLFFEKALELNPESVSKHKILSGISIHGYYSKIQARQDRGRSACEELSMDRQVPWATRWTALQNSTWYVRSSDAVIPGVSLTHVDFTPPDDYLPMNPSIINWGGKLRMIQRTVNYRITPSGHYDMRGDDAIRTRNWLLTLSDDLSVETANEILPPVDMPDPLYKLVIGFEDCRLFVWRDQLWCSSTVRELNQAGYCQIVLARIDLQPDGTYRFADYRVVHPQGVDLAHQKNWMPVVIGDDLRFIYSSDPVRIINECGETVALRPSAVASDSFRGGSQAIRFEDGWLAIIHQSVTMNDNRRRYLHRFVKYDDDFNLVGYTESFYISKLGIEFAAGMARHPVTNDIVVSFGIDDRESWLATFRVNDLLGAFSDVNEVTRIPNKCLTTTLATDYGIDHMVIAESNRPLSNKNISKLFVDQTAKLGLPVHPDFPKNWDNLIAIKTAIRTTNKDEPILDAGSSKLSVFLPGLRKMGYTNLTGIDLLQPQTEWMDDICYKHGDITKTDFPDEHFGFVACLSVIEHGVDDDLFLREMSRIIRDNGHLVVSMDYWQDPIDTGSRIAFGVPVQIYSAADIVAFAAKAQHHGFELISNLNTTCTDKVVNWIGLDYTFMNVVLRKNRQKKNKHPVVSLSAANIQMHVMPGDYISDHLIRDHVWEPELTANILDKSNSTDGGTFVDVGANLGYFSLIWASASPSNKAYCIEPVSRNIDLLRKNISLNRLDDRIMVLPIAAGDKVGLRSFDLGPDRETGHGGFAQSDRGSNHILVPTMRLDDCFDHIDVLKIDTEGADGLVLAGAERLLREKKISTIYFEVNRPRSIGLGLNPNLPIDILQSNDYKVELLRDCGPNMSEFVSYPNFS